MNRQISLRFFLVLILVLAVFFAWVGAMRNRSQVQSDAVQAILDLHQSRIDPGESFPDSELRIANDSAPVSYDSGDIDEREERGRWFPKWLLRTVGEECFHNVAKVSLSYREIENGDLVHLAALSDLVSLNLEATQVNDHGLDRLSHLNKLTYLGLGRTKITDDGISKLRHLPKLEELELLHNQIGNGGISHLREMKQLKRLNLCFTNVTLEGVMQLEQSLPNCEIWWNGSRAFQLINKCPIALGWGKPEPNPASIVRAVNFLHSLGKPKALSALREYTRVAPGEQTDEENPYCQSKLSLLIPILFETTVPLAPGQHWPKFYISIEDDIPFHNVNFGGRSGNPFGSLRPIVDWVEHSCRLRSAPLTPGNDPFKAAHILFDKLEDRDSSSVGLKEHLVMQARKMVGHVEAESQSDLVWDQKNQTYVIDPWKAKNHNSENEMNGPRSNNVD